MKKVTISAASGVLCRAEVADGPWTRMVGLLGRKGLDDGAGIWIKPSTSIHTFFMRFPIDVIYLDREAKVVKLCHRMGAWRLSFGGKGSHSVIELPSGWLENAGLEIGEQLQIDEGNGK